MKTDHPLRVIGTPDTLVEAVRVRAEAELGFPVVFEPLDGLALQRRAVLDPDSYDVIDHWSTSAELAWSAGAIQPIETDRVTEWDSLINADGAALLDVFGRGRGAAPGRRLFVGEDRDLGHQPTGRVIMLPTVHNCDSFGYAVALREKAMPAGEAESWSWLLDSRFRGRVALSNHASISGIEAALAAHSSGLLEFDDVGNLSVQEIDRLVELLIDLKRRGHFLGIWGSTEEAMQFMEQRGGSVQSIWEQGVTQLRTRMDGIRYAVPKEGYRGWLDGLFLSSALQGRVLDFAYEFLDWWLSGWPGAEMVRKGTYMTNPKRVREHLTASEWAYWYEGKPASEDLNDSGGHRVVVKNQSREGGSYSDRIGNVAVWNSFMDEHNYLTRKWNEFLAEMAR